MSTSTVAEERLLSEKAIAVQRLFSDPLYDTELNDKEFIKRMGLQVSEFKHLQADVTGNFRITQNYGALFYAVAARLPYAVYVAYGRSQYSIFNLVQLHKYDWVPCEYRGSFALEFQNTVKDAPDAIKRFYCDNEREAPMMMTVYLLCSLRGTRANDMCFSEVAPFIDGFKLSTARVLFSIKYVKKCDNTYLVDEPIRRQAFAQIYADLWRQPDFKNADYYSSPSYALWSVENHQDQWRTILQDISKDTCLIVPGDGVGVISTMWKGRIVSGDLNKIDLTAGVVLEEDFRMTLERGFRESGKKCVVLSYVAAFLDDSEWKLIADQKCPVMILDFKPVLRRGMGAPRVLGRGIVGYHCLDFVSFGREYRDLSGNVLYTENLLNIPNYEILSINEASTFLFSVAPRKLYVTSDQELQNYCVLMGYNVKIKENEEFVILTNYVEELVPNIALGKNVYFAPVGQLVHEIEHVDLELTSQFKSRCVYCCDDSILNRARLNALPVVEYKKKLYFYYVGNSLFATRYSYQSFSHVAAGTLTFLPGVLPAGGKNIVWDALGRLVLTIGESRFVIATPTTTVSLRTIAEVVPFKLIDRIIVDLLASFLSGLDACELRAADKEEKWKRLGHTHVRTTTPVEDLIYAYLSVVNCAVTESRLISVISNDSKWNSNDIRKALVSGIGEKWRRVDRPTKKKKVDILWERM